MATTPSMLSLYTKEAASGLGPAIVAEVAQDARHDVFAAMVYAHSINLQESTRELLAIAWMDRLEITEQLMRAGMLPDDLELFGPSPADCWLVRNIARLRGTHPLFTEWANLNDERLLILQHLPRIH